MFTRSYDRARELTRAALGISPPVGIVAAYRSPFWTITGGDAAGTAATCFNALKEMGVSTDEAEAHWKGFFHPGEEEDDDVAPYEHRAIHMTWDQADILLWNNLAQDIGVQPKAPVISALIDRARGISVFAYDDRGMDITALSPGPIEHLYRDYDSWLLDYDRPRMTEAFGAQASGD
jgi:hypothetical protein